MPAYYFGVLAPMRTVALACAAVLFPLLLVAGSSHGHEGHSHEPEAPAGAAPTSPRVAAMSERYQFVGIAEGEVLVIYLDRTDDNTPVTNADIEVTIDGEVHAAELVKKTGTYEVTAPKLRTPGSHEVLVAVAEGDANDLLVGSLVIPESTREPTAENELWRPAADAIAAIMRALGVGGTPERTALYLGGGLLVAGLIGAFVAIGRRRLALVVGVALGLAAASTLALAHEGHNHGPDLSASSGNAPSRRPDGTIFLPKPTQRLLQIRTQRAAVETRTRMVRFHGRVVPNPNRSGVVQSTIPGRYQPPASGVPPLGTRVKAGDLLGQVEPAFESIDSSDMAQTLGNLDQQIALTRLRLSRQERLLETNVVARATVEDIRTEIEGLEKRRRDLLAARVRPEELRAPVDGVIAATRVVAGQVISQSDQIFQIIDPASLLVEALVFDQIDPDAVTDATATLGQRGGIKLKFLGRSRALQNQYSILQFEIVETKIPLDAGTPLTVIASTGEPVTGILLPRAALAQATNGQTVVFAHTEPETFVPRPVRTESFDGERVLVTAGVEAGERVVVENAGLVNQVR